MKTILQEKMKIAESAFYEVINHIASKPAESGGAFFGSESDYIIRKFVPDTNAHTTRSTYTINSEYLNKVIKTLWEEEGLSLIGIVHSHPHGYASLSSPDMQYFNRLLGKLSRKKFYAPIVYSVPDGGFQMFPYVLNADGSGYQKGQLEIITDEPISDERVNMFTSQQEPKSNAGRFAQNAVALEWLLLECLFIGWLGYMLIRLSAPLTLFIVKIIEYGTK